MTDLQKRSLAFHPLATFVLRFSLALAAALLVFYIIPGFDVEVGHRSITLSHPTGLTPVLAAFYLLLAVGLSLFGWRAWIRHIGPWWRSGGDG
ncbi:hypothetical protein [Arenimonas soli]|nr:hypothetical protein [Arenimonas soli]